MHGLTAPEHRDKAVFRFLMHAGARDGAVASFRLKHVYLINDFVFQEGVKSKPKTVGRSTQLSFQFIYPIWIASLDGKFSAQ